MQNSQGTNHQNTRKTQKTLKTGIFIKKQEGKYRIFPLAI
jgi:hypothetical protein